MNPLLLSGTLTQNSVKNVQNVRLALNFQLEAPRRASSSTPFEIITRVLSQLTDRCISGTHMLETNDQIKQTYLIYCLLNSHYIPGIDLLLEKFFCIGEKNKNMASYKDVKKSKMN